MALSNDQMKEGRFLKLYRGRKLYRRMNSCRDAGGFVRIATNLRVTDLQPKHRELVMLGKSGSLYLRRGKSNDCIDFCGFGFSA